MSENDICSNGLGHGSMISVTRSSEQRRLFAFSCFISNCLVSSLEYVADSANVIMKVIFRILLINL